MTFRKTTWEWVSLALSCLAMVAYLWPTLSLPYTGDDMFNAYIDGWMGYEHLSLFDGFRAFLSAEGPQGRFYPFFSVIVFTLYHGIHNLLAVKTLDLAAIVVNAITLYAALRLLAPRIALLSVAFLPALWQIRRFHDPIISFSLHMQVTLEFLLLALCAFALFAKGGRPWVLFVSGLAYACACLTYEPTYAFAPVYIALAYILLPDNRGKIAATIAFALPVIVCAAVAFAIRSANHLAATDQHAVNAVPGAVWHTFWIQALGALPLSYRLLDPAAIFAVKTRWRATDVIVACLAFAAVFLAAITSLRSIGRDRSSGIRPTLGATTFGIAGWLLAGLVVATSPRWQIELVPGLAYLPVYFGEFAFSTVLGGIAYIVVSKVEWIGSVALAACAALAVVTTYRADAIALLGFVPWNMTVPIALDAGLLQGAMDGDVVYVDDSYPANSLTQNDSGNVKYFFFGHTGRRLVIDPIASLPVKPIENSYAMLGSTRGFDAGAVVAGRISDVLVAGLARLPMVDSATLVERDPTHPLRIVRWTSSCGPVLESSLLDRVPTALQLDYDGPLSVTETDGHDRWRWSAGDVALRFVNDTARARDVRLSFDLRAIASDRVLRVDGPGIHVGKSAGDDLHVDTPLHIRAHEVAKVSLATSGKPLVKLPDSRPLLMQVRNVLVTEPACGSIANR